jgi:RNA polymerase sigma-70 factor (ECF subfamily)
MEGSVSPWASGLPEGLAAAKCIEEALVDRALQGGRDAFGDLIHPHLSFLNRFARAKLQSESDAEDVVQQSILKALIHLQQFRQEASFKSWISAITENEVLRLRRDRGVRAQITLRFATDLAADSGRSPHTEIELAENAAWVHRAVTRLPRKYRLIIQLRDLRELSIAETAQRLKLSSSAVRTRHHRARKLLKRSLKEFRKDALLTRQ